MQCKYCPHCGTPTSLRDVGDEGEIPWCPGCDTPLFDSPYPCVLAVTLDEQNRTAVLMQHYITKDHWVLPAGYIKSGHTAEETLSKELMEETGLSVISSEYIDSYHLEHKDVLIFGFFARVAGELQTNSPEVDDLKWASFEEVGGLLRPGGIGHSLYLTAKQRFRL